MVCARVPVWVSLRLYRVVQEGSEGVSTRVTVTATNRSTGFFRSVLRRIIIGFIRVLYGLFEGDDSAP